jgi:hypothetical protein
LKTLEQKLAEKQRTLADINTTLDMSMELYQITTAEYGEVVRVNKGKTDGKALTGISSMLSKINELLRSRNDIENEINALIELDDQGQTEETPNTVSGSKEAILQLLDGMKKERKVE